MLRESCAATLPNATDYVNASTDATQLRDCDLAFLKARAIDPDVAAERGYRTARPGDLLRLGFSQTQVALGDGLLIPIHAVDGGIAYHQFRPDVPRLDDKGKPRKYEIPYGQHMLLDAHPRIRHLLGDPNVPLIITESAPKADALVSLGYVAIAMNGCWGFRHTNERGGKTIVPCFEAIALNGRDIFIANDSDAFTSLNVAAATERLGRWNARKAHVKVLRIPPMADGEKQGVDDFVASGGDIAQLIADAVPLGRFIDERPRQPAPESEPDNDDAAGWKAMYEAERDRRVAAEDHHRQFMQAQRCQDPSIRKTVPTLAALHYAHASALSREANTDPRILRSLAADGSMRITRKTVGEIAGRGEKTVTSDLTILEALGCATHSVTRLFPGDIDPDSGEIVSEPRSIMRVVLLRSAADNFAVLRDVPAPSGEPNTGHGGRRICVACGSQQLTLVCGDCGHHQPAAAPAPKKPMQTVKGQVDLSGTNDAAAVENPPTSPPHSTKEVKMTFHDVDRVFSDEFLKVQDDLSGSEPADAVESPPTSPARDAERDSERRAALRKVQPAARHHREPTSAPTLSLDERIVDVVTAATAKKQPLHEDAVALAVGAPKRDVRPALRVLAGQRRLKRWDDGLLTAVPAAGMTGD